MTISEHKVVLHALGRSRSRVEYLDETLLVASDQPIFDACRALLAKGLRGTLRAYHSGSKHCAMIVDIESGAKLRVLETPTEGPRIADWKPFLGISSEITSSLTRIAQKRQFAIGAGDIASDFEFSLGAGTSRRRRPVQRTTSLLVRASQQATPK